MQQTNDEVAIVISIISLVISFSVSLFTVLRQTLFVPNVNNKMRYFSDILRILNELETVMLAHNGADSEYYIDILFGSKGKQIRKLLSNADELQYNLKGYFKDRHKKLFEYIGSFEKGAGKLSDKEMQNSEKIKIDILRNLINSEIYIEELMFERKVKHL